MLWTLKEQGMKIQNLTVFEHRGGEKKMLRRQIANSRNNTSPTFNLEKNSSRL